MVTTIQVTEKPKDALERMNLFSRNPYEEGILRRIEISKEEKELSTVLEK